MISAGVRQGVGRRRPEVWDAGHPLQIDNLGQREFARLIAAAKVKPITLPGLGTCAQRCC